MAKQNTTVEGLQVKSPAIKLQRIKSQYKIFPYKFKVIDGKFYMYLDIEDLNNELSKLDYTNLSHSTKYLIFGIQGEYVNSLKIELGEAILVKINETTGCVEEINLGQSVNSRETLIKALGYEIA